MSESLKPVAGSPFPDLSWPQTDDGRLAPAEMTGWRMLVVYRGSHCPICKQYLTALEGLKTAFLDAGVQVAALSSDPGERATREAEAEGWTFPVGYGLTPEEMRTLGLYVSSPRSAEETDRPFPEPGVFVVNPEGRLQIVDISNAPFARPDLSALLGGLKFVQAMDYPIRGMA